MTNHKTNSKEPYYSNRINIVISGQDDQNNSDGRINTRNNTMSPQKDEGKNTELNLDEINFRKYKLKKGGSKSGFNPSSE